MNNLIIFLKYPEPGKVKTRLAKDLGAEKAADIYSNMAKTIVGNVIDPENYNTTIFYDPPEKEEEIKSWIDKKELQFSPQIGNTLGEKISNAFSQIFKNGADKTVIIGSDCIDVTLDIINETLEFLEHNDVVIGPAEDGGYYLLGLSQNYTYLFDNINWSTEMVLDQTISKVKEKKLKFKLLSTFKDIDNVYDLKAKFKDLLKLT